jgi:DNA-directed RNA polymerase subunit RPC12/RpoP
MDTFICHDCGKKVEDTNSKRKVCPDCLRKRIRERNLKSSYARLEQEKESNALKAAAKQVEKYTNAAYEAQKAHDAEIDARSREQIRLQCRFCKYRLQDLSNKVTRGCDYVSHTGKLRNRGTGKVGECGSFVPFESETKEERTKRRRRALTISEADKAQYTGEKMRDVNQL